MIIHVLWVEKKAGRATITHRQLGEETRFFFWRDSGDERQIDIEVEVVRVVWTYVHTYIYIYIYSNLWDVMTTCALLGEINAHN